jgi:hypothetical protein
MARKVLIQVRRGAESSIGTLAAGELGYCTDTRKLYIGTATGNVLLVAAQSTGDMLKGIYDTNNNGKVDVAEVADAVPWAGVMGKPETFAPSSFANGKYYNGTVGGSTDLGWKKLFRMTGADRSGTGGVTSTGNFYDAGTVMGVISDRNGNFNQSGIGRYPFQFVLNAWSGTARMDSAQLYIPSGIPDLLRIVKYGVNDYELQIRSPSTYRQVSFEVWEIGSTLSQFAFQSLSAESGTFTVAKNNTAFNGLIDGPSFADLRNKPTTRAGYGITDAMPQGPLTWAQLRGDA